MNIFEALSQGRGKINEENMSAMLAFLLSPNQTHGLGDLFLRQFLKAVAVKCENEVKFDNLFKQASPIKGDAFIEPPYILNKDRTRYIDIEVRIYDEGLNKSLSRKDNIEVHRLAIENKISSQSADPRQLIEEFEAIKLGLEKDETSQITMVYLTPHSDHPKFKEAYDALSDELLGAHQKTWLKWSSDSDDEHTIAAIIKNILKKEAMAEIPPISEYTRHTLKAFVQHIAESPARITRKVADGFNIAEQIFVEVAGIKYSV